MKRKILSLFMAVLMVSVLALPSMAADITLPEEWKSWYQTYMNKTVGLQVNDSYVEPVKTGFHINMTEEYDERNWFYFLGYTGDGPTQGWADFEITEVLENEIKGNIVKVRCGYPNSSNSHQEKPVTGEVSIKKVTDTKYHFSFNMAIERNSTKTDYVSAENVPLAHEYNKWNDDEDFPFYGVYEIDTDKSYTTGIVGGAQQYPIEFEIYPDGVELAYNFHQYISDTETYTIRDIFTQGTPGEDREWYSGYSWSLEEESGSHVTVYAKEGGNLRLTYNIIKYEEGRTFKGECYLKAKEEPAEPQDYNVNILGNGMSNTGEYLVNVMGNIQGTFDEGANILTGADIQAQNLTITTFNLTNGANRVMGISTVEGITVTVTNGKVINVEVKGRAQTNPGNFDRYTVNCNTI